MPQITVDTGLNTKPVLNGVRDMNSAVRSLRSVVSQAGKDMNVSTVGYAKAMRNSWKLSRQAKQQVVELDNEYQNLMQQLDKLANSKIPTKQYSELSADIEEVDKNLERLIDKRDRLYAKGNAARNSLEYAQTVDEIKKLRAEYASLDAARKKLESSGKAFVLGEDTQEFARLQKQANETIAAANMVRAQADKDAVPLHIKEWNEMSTATGAVANGMARVANAGLMLGHALINPFGTLNRLIPMIVSGIGALAQKVASAAMAFAKMAVSRVVSFLRGVAIAAKNAAVNLARMAANGIVSGIKNIGSMAAKAGKAILSIGKSTKKSNGGLKEAVTMLIRYGFGVRSIFMLVRRLRSAIVDAFKNMASKVPEVNQAVSKLSSSLDMLKNRMATAFQPVLTAVAPILATFMDMLSEALTKVGMFFAALTGQDYVYDATKANIDYAKSLDKTSKSAKKAENQLASFDKLDILKANDGNGDSSSSDVSSTSNFAKTPIESAIKTFANKLKDMLKNGELAQLGKMLAEKVNSFIESIDVEKYARKVGQIVNGALDIYNAFMEGIDWDNIGRKFATGINGLLSTVNWTELGRALSQRINAIWGIISGLVYNVDWVTAGKALGEAVWGYFGNIKWDKIGSTIGTAINGISTAIINFATTFPWREFGQKVATGLNNLFDTTSLEKIVTAFTTTLNGALDTLLEIVGNFKWGENGEKFRLAVLKLIESFPADKLGHLLTISIKGILDLMAPTISDLKVWSNLGTRLGAFMNRLFGDREMWTKIGETANGMLNGILTFGESFLATFKADVAANNIKTALAQIDFDDIATKTWGLIKLAFKKAGDFLNVLFADESNSHYDPWKKMYIPDPGTSLAERVGKKLKEALEHIPWGDIWDTLKYAAQAAFKGIEDFLMGLLGIDSKEVGNTASEKAVAIGQKIGQALQQAINAAIDFGKMLIDTFDPDTFRDALTAAIGEIRWGDIAVAILTGLGGSFRKLLESLPLAGELFSALFSEIDNTERLNGIMKEIRNAIGSGMDEIASLSGVKGGFTFDAFYEGVRAKTIKNGAIMPEFENFISQLFNGDQSKIEAFMGGSMTGEEFVTALGDKMNGGGMSRSLSNFFDLLTGEATAGTNEISTTTVDVMADSMKAEMAARETELRLQAESVYSPDISQAAKEQTEKTASAAVDKYVLKLEERAPEIEQAADNTFTKLPAPEELAEMGYQLADVAINSDLEQMEGRQEEVKQMAHDTFGTKTQEGISESADATESTMSNSMDRVVGAVEQKWGEASNIQSEKLSGMESNLSTSMGEMTGTSETGTENTAKPFYDKYGEIMVAVDECMREALYYLSQHSDSMVSKVKSSSGDMSSAASTGMNDLANTFDRGGQRIGNMGWEYIGANITYGICNGIYNNWSWLNNVVWNLADSLYQSACNALGIASPSRVFRDKVGAMIGLGLAEGVEETQPEILGVVADVATAMQDKMSDESMQIAVDTDDAFTGFGDTIVDGFTALMDKLQAIADSVTFRMPAVAAGTVVPYNVSTRASAANSPLTDALTASNEDMENVVIQATNNAALAIVNAIQKYSGQGGTELNVSKVIDEINRRTRAQGVSPIIV